MLLVCIFTLLEQFSIDHATSSKLIKSSVTSTSFSPTLSEVFVGLPCTGSLNAWDDDASSKSAARSIFFRTTTGDFNFMSSRLWWYIFSYSFSKREAGEAFCIAVFSVSPNLFFNLLLYKWEVCLGWDFWYSSSFTSAESKHIEIETAYFRLIAQWSSRWRNDEIQVPVLPYSWVLILVSPILKCRLLAYHTCQKFKLLWEHQPFFLTIFQQHLVSIKFIDSFFQFCYQIAGDFSAK